MSLSIFSLQQRIKHFFKAAVIATTRNDVFYPLKITKYDQAQSDIRLVTLTHLTNKLIDHEEKRNGTRQPH